MTAARPRVLVPGAKDVVAEIHLQGLLFSAGHHKINRAGCEAASGTHFLSVLKLARRVLSLINSGDRMSFHSCDTLPDREASQPCQEAQYQEREKFPLGPSERQRKRAGRTEARVSVRASSLGRDIHHSQPQASLNIKTARWRAWRRRAAHGMEHRKQRGQGGASEEEASEGRHGFPHRPASWPQPLCISPVLHPTPKPSPSAHRPLEDNLHPSQSGC